MRDVFNIVEIRAERRGGALLTVQRIFTYQIPVAQATFEMREQLMDAFLDGSTVPRMEFGPHEHRAFKVIGFVREQEP